jgi:hypothetical protein
MAPRLLAIVTVEEALTDVRLADLEPNPVTVASHVVVAFDIVEQSDEALDGVAGLAAKACKVPWNGAASFAGLVLG